MRRLAAFAALALVGASPEVPEPSVRCEDAKTQLDLNLCAMREVAQEDAKLAATYDELKKKLDSGELAKFEAARTAWLRYRDAQCNAEAASWEGGSIQGFMYSRCRSRLTRNRQQELEVMMSGLGR